MNQPLGAPVRAPIRTPIWAPTLSGAPKQPATAHDSADLAASGARDNPGKTQ